MSRIFITSDWHFSHDRPFVWEARGFNSVNEMNEAIIQRHNSVVNKEDTVYVLGDCCLGGGSKEVLIQNMELIERLNGNLIFINGNHDTDNRVAMYLACANCYKGSLDALRIKYKGYHFYLSHYPTITANYDERALKQCTINLYGHTHQNTNFYNGYWTNYHVGMDSHNCYPVLLDDIIEEIKLEYYKTEDQL